MEQFPKIKENGVIGNILTIGEGAALAVLGIGVASILKVPTEKKEYKIIGATALGVFGLYGFVTRRVKREVLLAERTNLQKIGESNGDSAAKEAFDKYADIVTYMDLNNQGASPGQFYVVKNVAKVKNSDGSEKVTFDLEHQLPGNKLIVTKDVQRLISEKTVESNPAIKSRRFVDSFPILKTNLMDVNWEFKSITSNPNFQVIAKMKFEGSWWLATLIPFFTAKELERKMKMTFPESHYKTNTK
jgi:hypothetical protein